MIESPHTFFMKEALKLAQQAYHEGEIPVGAVVVSDQHIIGKGYNQMEKLQDATAHAEMIAITAASDYLRSRHLHHCALYVTLEPCVMCAGAIKWSQIQELVYGAEDIHHGFHTIKMPILPKNMSITKRVCESECKALMDSFFQDRIRNR